MKISVITPTADRAHFLKGAYHLLKAQKHLDWEWLIYDTSACPSQFSDPRVSVIHDESIVSIGEKRRRLAYLAKGDAIVHFDDDDYYAPTYLNTIIQALESADFFTLHSWFSFDLKTGQVFYWASDEQGERHFMLSPLTGAKICEIELGPYMEAQREKMNLHGKIGYGFSFAYRKQVAEVCPFSDLDLGEDWRFYRKVEEAGFRVVTVADKEGEVVHVMHDANTAPEYPQYRIPRFLVEDLLKGFFSYINSKAHEN